MYVHVYMLGESGGVRNIFSANVRITVIKLSKNVVLYPIVLHYSWIIHSLTITTLPLVIWLSLIDWYTPINNTLFSKQQPRCRLMTRLAPCCLLSFCLILHYGGLIFQHCSCPMSDILLRRTAKKTI